VNLLSWLTSDKYRDTVEKVRGIQDEALQKTIKANLPAITPSGTFSTRSEKGLIEHSGFIAFDIDFKDNSDIENFDELKKQLSKLSNVAYCGLSVRGKGFWGCVPVPRSTPDIHKQRFNALAKDFKLMGIKLDPSGSDICRLRIYSWDPDGYFNHNAKPYLKILRPQQRTVTRPALTDTRERVEAIISRIKENKTDITEGYQSWLKIASALANEFNEGGRGYFHAVSMFHPKYSIQDTDRMFDNVLKHDYNKVTIASFFKIASDCGQLIKEGQQRGEIAKQKDGYNKYGVPDKDTIKTLSDIGISRKESSTFQTIAGPWSNEIAELEQFFNAVRLPEAPIRLNAVERITDPSLFIKSHLDVVKGQNGHNRYLPYLERLKELKTMI
jgi:hypothetical protein